MEKIGTEPVDKYTRTFCMDMAVGVLYGSETVVFHCKGRTYT